MLDVPPPGPGFCTATFAVAAEARSNAETCAVREVVETKVVEIALLFHSTMEEAIKPIPETEMVSEGLSTEAEFGVIAVIDGMGFPMVKVMLPDLPPPGAGF